ncbi:YqaJ viral recombinase family protein [Chitiniphilus shinanonensis]|uniref:YqaJ viral recombinase family nuclease n=1 Tax=Chitiniphilus shinanonensis TaxID=553088 RepID=UPI003038A329
MTRRYAQSIRVASTLQMSREAWLALRGSGIGSSDAAAAIGLSPYKSPLSLWLEKTGRKVPEDLSAKPAVRWGTVLEPVLAGVYAEETGCRVRRVNAVLRHAEHGFMLANLDRELVGHPDGSGLLEIKTAGYHLAPQWEDGIPVAYQCQVLHQLAVTGHPWADVAVLIGGQDFRVYRVARDEARIADLVRLESRFWRHVQSDLQPDPDGSDDAAAALQWLYPAERGPIVDWTETPEYNALFLQLVQLRERKQAVEAEEARVRQRLQQALGEAAGAICQGGRLSWRKSKDRLVPDLEQMASEHPEWLAAYSKPVPGSRRFLVQAERGGAA